MCMHALLPLETACLIAAVYILHACMIAMLEWALAAAGGYVARPRAAPVRACMYVHIQSMCAQESKARCHDMLSQATNPTPAS